jgi:uncharacterized phage protein gp47/JayE
MAIQIKTYDDILTELKNAIINKTGIPFPFNEGDVITSLVEGIALQLSELYATTIEVLRSYFLDTAQGQQLDLRVSEFTTRRMATKAGGYVKFMKGAGYVNTDITIPQDTEVAVPETESQPEIRFRTIRPLTIPAGQSEGLVFATAVEYGSKGNVGANTITKLITYIDGITGVTNPYPFSGGSDTETDAEFRVRIRETIRGLVRGVYPSLYVACYNTTTTAGQQVKTASFKPIDGNKHYLIVNDGTTWCPSPITASQDYSTVPSPSNILKLPWYPTLNTVSVSAGTSALQEGVDYWVVYNYKQVILAQPVQTGITYHVTAYTYDDELINTLYDTIAGDITDPYNKPGYLPAGVQILIKPASVITQNVEATITVATTFDPFSVKDAVISAIQTHLDNKRIGETLYVSELIDVIMDVEGVLNCTLTTPSSDVLVNDDQVVRAGTITIHV